MMTLTFVTLAASLLLLRTGRFTKARAAAVTMVLMLLGGWVAAQYPYLLVPDFTLQNSAANKATLKLMVIALAAGSVLLLPSLYVMFRVFKGSKAFTLRD